MLGSGRLSKLVPIKTEGEMRTQVIEQEGPIVFVESTTLTNIFDEDLNRAILLNTDERQTQTKKVINTIAAKYASNDATSRKQVIERHHALQRMIEPLTVLVPFAPTLAEHFTTERVEARRSFPHLLSLIQASALLHQLQRKRNEDGYVLADEHDYHLARQLGGGLSEPAKRFFEQIIPIVGSSTFRTKDARRHVQGGRTAVYGWLSELEDAGIAQIVDAQKGSKPATWKIVGQIDDAVVQVLPATEVLFPDSTRTPGHKT